MAVRNYRDLICWQRAMGLVDGVYRLTQQLPPEEKFGLTSQLRRSAVSVPSNVAEGEGRFSAADFKRFLSIAHGSLREVETQLFIAVRLGYLQSKEAEPLLALAAETGRLIQGLAKSLKTT